MQLVVTPPPGAAETTGPASYKPTIRKEKSPVSSQLSAPTVNQRWKRVCTGNKIKMGGLGGGAGEGGSTKISAFVTFLFFKCSCMTFLREPSSTDWIPTYKKTPSASWPNVIKSKRWPICQRAENVDKTTLQTCQPKSANITCAHIQINTLIHTYAADTHRLESWLTRAEPLLFRRFTINFEVQPVNKNKSRLWFAPISIPANMPDEMCSCGKCRYTCEASR